MLDAFWHLLVEFDPVEELRRRTKQKAYLARYGRQDWFAWEDREVSELDEAVRAIGDIVEAENESNRPNTEDR